MHQNILKLLKYLWTFLGFMITVQWKRFDKINNDLCEFSRKSVLWFQISYCDTKITVVRSLKRVIALLLHSPLLVHALITHNDNVRTHVNFMLRNLYKHPFSGNKLFQGWIWVLQNIIDITFINLLFLLLYSTQL